jgi:ABC-type polysaccharide/polyol phosphate export permease
MLALSLLLLGISWFNSAVGVFMPDMEHIVSVFGRILFYFTPVFWSLDMLNPRLQYFLKFNPLFYIAMGYRESLYYSVPFWNHPLQTLYFWGWVVLMMLLGVFVFRKLRPQFADYI